ncbi:Arsenical resistance operon repressor [Aedoeadaptatus ivorii]|uniref:Arsenical resistance operon repressor n=1 Tax=Aedoeadaptatus ivorii TaxID=54006 RepID=A0A448V0M0_9FIRM|nr:metalloregulator ArsR/SmtB family transcription factor [Peptoniphilus ivorii]MDQ0507564.1 ArsR family transcriptional regulator [Peptoniphilus ivorii]VEJ35169.1 Arsenical resistance operon repressor [Peptoniphilus ivorii]
MEEYKEIAKIFKAFCDERRLAILDLLRSGEECSCVLLEHLPLTQSGLSYHMKILTESGIVVGRQEGRWTYYRISEAGREAAIEVLMQLTQSEE